MVVTSRGMEEGRNGRRSRGPSPNGALSDDSSATDDSDDHGMRVGKDYQAVLPPFNPDRKKIENKVEAMLVWAPPTKLSEDKILEYIATAKYKHAYNTEQALGMLFWHKHNVEKALADLPNFTPFPDEWTVEDKVLYEQAFSFHGKSFARIRQMLPDKSIPSLVKYYYSWKKTRARSSLMDRQAKKLHSKNLDSDDGSGTGSDSDFEPRRDDKDGLRQGSKSTQSYGKHMKHKHRPPRGMYLNRDDLLSIATGPSGQGEAILKQLEAENVTLKRTVQNNKQIISMQKYKTSSGIDCFRLPENTQKMNPKWTNDELLWGVQAVRRYGRDLKAIAEVIGNKTEANIRSFMSNYTQKFHLDEVLAEHDAEYGAIEIGDDDDDKKMEIEEESAPNNTITAKTDSNGSSSSAVKMETTVTTSSPFSVTNGNSPEQRSTPVKTALQSQIPATSSPKPASS